MDVQVTDDTELFTQPPSPTIAGDIESFDSEDYVKKKLVERKISTRIC